MIRNNFGLAIVIVLIGLLQLSGCSRPNDPSLASEENTTQSRSWSTRWGTFTMGPWTTEQLLDGCSRGRHAADTPARLVGGVAWAPLGELLPEAVFRGSSSAGTGWCRLATRLEETLDRDPKFIDELAAATGGKTATPFVPTMIRGPRLKAWLVEVRPLIEEVLELGRDFGPEDVLDGGGVSQMTTLQDVLVIEAADSVANQDFERAIQTLESLATLGRQLHIGLNVGYSEESREYDLKMGDEPGDFQQHEDFQALLAYGVLARIQGILGTWEAWRMVPGARDRLAAALDWSDPVEIEDLARRRGSGSVRGGAPGWTAEDRARRRHDMATLLLELRG